jgi:hypothetical protein
MASLNQVKIREIIMKTNVTFSQFTKAFHDYGRENNFSYKGFKPSTTTSFSLGKTLEKRLS